MKEQDGATERSQDDPSKLLNLSETVGGCTTRKYLNETVTPVLLSGMKMIAVRKPEDPLKVLGEYLIEQSKISEVPKSK